MEYELSMNWGPQIEVWAKLEKELGLTKPKSGADILDLKDPKARFKPLFGAWDALYHFIGARGDELYFQTTKDAQRIFSANPI